MQIKISYDLFSQPIKPHDKENNAESQIHLEKNRKRFSKKCEELLRRLLNGEKLKFADCVRDIGDLRRRSLDLIELGIPIQRKFLNGENIKTYYINPEDISWIKEKYFPND